MNSLGRLAFLALLSIAPALSAAELSVSAVFSDHMVLQQGKPVPVWGWANAGDKITVSFGQQKQSTTADQSGKWTATLEPLQTSDQPQQMVIASTAQDRPIRINDILVGEVWLASGQSNMAMTVNRAQDFDKEQAAANLPRIRVFTERSSAAPTASEQAKGEWVVCSPDTVGGFSATAFFMGKELHNQLAVPVGLVVSAVGGTPIENWIDADKQKAVPELEEFTTSLLNATANFDEAAAATRYEKQVEAWKVKAGEARKAGKEIPRKPRDPVSAHRAKGGPGDLFNGKIAPLVPYAVRGMIWYQGEGNSHPGKSHLYVHHMPTLIKEWRALWGDDSIPFGMVQLPNFERDGEGWSEVQEAFLKTVQNVPNTGMAITIDVGDPKDIHPKNKQAVGQRLANWALGAVYKQQVADTMGPLPAGHTINAGTVTVTFDHCNSGLKSHGDLTGFEVSDSEGNWHPANAQIVDHAVTISSTAVKHPTAARYAWTANPTASLFNGAGIPASPFRTTE